MKFSIIIVTYNRKKELDACLRSITAQNISIPHEVIIIFNGENSYYERIRESHPDFKSYYITASSPSHARNVGITKASGELLFFLDDDCTLPDGYFDKIDFSQKWDVMGGPDRTPSEATPLQKQIGFALASPFCMGPTFKRHSSETKNVNSHSSEFELILCNLWFRRDIFSKEGFLFSEELFRNEENFLLKQLKLVHKRIFYNPAMFVYHSRKDSIERLAAAIVKSGECRVKNYLKIPLSIELIYLLPVVFIFSFFFWIFHPSTFLTPVFLLYFAAVYLYGVFSKKTFNPEFTGLHFLILLFYSFGLVRELIRQALTYLIKLLNR